MPAPTRRQLFFILGLGLGAGMGLSARASNRSGPLRPPGAIDEDEFPGACIRCGQCVQACPVDCLNLAPGSAGLLAGMPFLTPRDAPCELCPGLDEPACIAACPADALGPIDDWKDIAMGTAVINPDQCLVWQGVICRSCWHACPFPDEAISLGAGGRPVVHPEACIGCGLCDRACLAEPSAIPIVPASQWSAEPLTPGVEATDDEVRR